MGPPGRSAPGRRPTTLDGMTNTLSPRDLPTPTSTPTPTPTAHRTPPDAATGAGAALQRAGGVAALVQAATYVVGFAAMAAWLGPRGFAEAQGDPAAALSFLLANQSVMYLWYLLIYLVAGVALVVLVLGVHDRIRAAGPALAQTATAFGLLWSGVVLASGMVSLVGQRTVVGLAATDGDTAATTWSAVSAVQDGLGGGIELVGAVWVLLVAVLALRTGVLPRGQSVLGLCVGLVGIATLVPQATVAASVFGLGFILWYVLAGLALLRR